MGVSISCKNNVVTACIDGDIDHHTAKDIREKVDSYIVRTSPKLLILDFKELVWESFIFFNVDNW